MTFQLTEPGPHRPRSPRYRAVSRSGLSPWANNPATESLIRFLAAFNTSSCTVPGAGGNIPLRLADRRKARLPAVAGHVEFRRPKPPIRPGSWEKEHAKRVEPVPPLFHNDDTQTPKAVRSGVVRTVCRDQTVEGFTPPCGSGAAFSPTHGQVEGGGGARRAGFHGVGFLRVKYQTLVNDVWWVLCSPGGFAPVPSFGGSGFRRWAQQPV